MILRNSRLGDVHNDSLEFRIMNFDEEDGTWKWLPLVHSKTPGRSGRGAWGVHMLFMIDDRHVTCAKRQVWRMCRDYTPDE